MNLNKLSLIAVVTLTTACSMKMASIKVPDNLSAQIPQKLTTAGAFWGLGMDGTFDLVGLYRGKYDRSASTSSWGGNFITSAEGSMISEVVNSATGKTWVLNCYGGGTSVNVGNFSFGGDSPYKCDILSENKNKVGGFELKKSAGMIDFGPTGKVEGTLKLSGKTYQVESIHDAEGSFIPVDHPLGYYIKKNGQTVAAIQVNGSITLQSDGNDMDSYAIATIASALSVRPEG